MVTKQILRQKKTRKLIQQNGKRQTKRRHRGGYADPKPDVCSKNINEMLVSQFKTDKNAFDTDPKKFAQDIKNEANSVKNVASGNWFALPGPPPKFPKCVIM